ncbi:hypothetical protein LTQ56_05595 [Mycobacterium intracellulare subsp. intracellulare]|uniref:hypothetical protein n=1 Tax=Mycobacterium intracellulare TaxID=1767 RepID=UPI0001B45756|nr:hypothetical protein [Mycobacterium intracellulare]UGU08147.1 hypothetical protein LTQ56_05595 [Mycobacterium intracellulare subsp. intracellulare]BCO57169.1 hypothetical protein MINTM005_24130 [Mycobacterium intracellulare]BCO94273.1 hypothetical protein MINTM016_22490 [Mycobacterium intracellulare]
MSEAARQAQRDAKAAAAEALRGVRKTTAMPRPLQFLTGEAVLLESREPAKRPWSDV